MSVKCVIRQIGGMMKQKNVVFPDVVDATTINENEFVEMMCRNRNLGAAQVKAVLSGLSQSLGQLLSLGHRVRVEGLGTFSLDVKAKLERDKNGVLQLQDAAVKGVRMTPATDLMKEVGDCKFSLASHEVFRAITPDKDAAKATVAQMLEEKPFFVASELKERLGVSLSSAQRLLKGLEAEGAVRKSRNGHNNIWAKG